MLSQLLIMVCLWYTILTIVLASTCINQVHFPHTLDTLAQSYELKGMVRCASHHFAKAINNSLNGYALMICWLVRSASSIQDL